jgi:hypothetical protein
VVDATLLGVVEKATGRSLQPSFGPSRPGHVKHSSANIDRTRARLGYEPSLPFEVGS